jgi:hypothetical protein
MQDIPLFYSASGATVNAAKKSRFNDPATIITDTIGYYKRVRNSVVYIPVMLTPGVIPVITEDMFFEDIDKFDEPLSDQEN